MQAWSGMRSLPSFLLNSVFHNAARRSAEPSDARELERGFRGQDTAGPSGNFSDRKRRSAPARHRVFPSRLAEKLGRGKCRASAVAGRPDLPFPPRLLALWRKETDHTDS